MSIDVMRHVALQSICPMPRVPLPHIYLPIIFQLNQTQSLLSEPLFIDSRTRHRYEPQIPDEHDWNWLRVLSSVMYANAFL